MMKKFDRPIYITQPILPDLELYKQSLESVWREKWLTNNGSKHRLFEQSLRDYLAVPALSLFNNGTIALITAVQSLELTGEVITTPFTFPATPHVLSWNNITPVFCDINESDFNIDADKIENLITEKTTGILAVHVFGTPCNTAMLREIADKHNLKIIYDAAHAFAVHYKGQPIGTYGDITMFSFHATKMFHTAEGGALTYNDRAMKEKIDLLKNFGIKNENEVILPGINGKMNELQASLGLLLLDMIADEKQKRQRIAELYTENLKDIPGILLPEIPKDTEPNFQYYVIRIQEEVFDTSRDAVYEKFKEYNVFTRRYFYPLCSNYPCYEHLESSAADKLPVANKIINEVLCLPLYGDLPESDVLNICDILKSFGVKS